MILCRNRLMINLNPIIDEICPYFAEMGRPCAETGLVVNAVVNVDQASLEILRPEMRVIDHDVPSRVVTPVTMDDSLLFLKSASQTASREWGQRGDLSAHQVGFVDEVRCCLDGRTIVFVQTQDKRTVNTDTARLDCLDAFRVTSKHLSFQRVAVKAANILSRDAFKSDEEDPAPGLMEDLEHIWFAGNRNIALRVPREVQLAERRQKSFRIARGHEHIVIRKSDLRTLPDLFHMRDFFDHLTHCLVLDAAAVDLGGHAELTVIRTPTCRLKPHNGVFVRREQIVSRCRYGRHLDDIVV